MRLTAPTLSLHLRRQWHIALTALATSSLLTAAQAACMGMELQAHRGAAGFPENSYAAVQAAVQGAWEGAEIDVQSLSDGELALHHDALTTRTTSLRGRMVRQLDSTAWSEVRLKDSKGKLTAERAPFLRDVVPMVQASGKVLNVEIKEEFRNCSTAHATTRLLLAGMPAGRWGISATDSNHLRCVRQLDAQAYLGIISLDHASIALSNQRTASRAQYLRSAQLSPEYLAKLVRNVAPPVGLHMDVYSLRANPNVLADARHFRLPVLTYSMKGDSHHIAELARHYQHHAMLPSGAIIDGAPQAFCQQLAQAIGR